MSLSKGTLTVRRYAVLAPHPDNLERLVKGVRAHAYLPLDPASDVLSSTGWVSSDDSDDLDLHQGKIAATPNTGRQVRLAMRTDSLKPPAAEVKKRVRARAAEIEAERGTPLSKREKRGVKEEVIRVLKQKVLPRSRVIDVLWFTDQASVYFFSTSKGANEDFVDLFMKSFGAPLERFDASRMAANTVPAEARKDWGPTPELWRGFTGLRPLGDVVEDDDEEDGE